MSRLSRSRKFAVRPSGAGQFSTMRLHGIAIAMFALGVAACTVPPEQRSRDVATAYCKCTQTGQSAVDMCIDQLVPMIPNVSDDCLDCVYQNSATCSSLLNDCTNLCDPQQNTPLLGGMR